MDLLDGREIKIPLSGDGGNAKELPSKNSRHPFLFLEELIITSFRLV